MRIIFVTPLLWRRLDRAVRRREEGQALILIALASIAMVAVVGLAVDGGMAYLEAQKLQRAADNAALAGVVWVPNQPTVADGRGKLAAQANGYNIYKDTNPNNTTYITSNWSYNEVMDPAQVAGARTSYVSAIPADTQYRVTLGVKARRYFLGVIGLGDYYIQRTATAQYSRQIKLGSSFNYFGSSGVLYDPSVNGSVDENQTYARYVTNRCNQVPPPGQSLPSPCVGTFWANIGGTDSVHSSGDAYNPIGDGYLSTGTSNITNTGNWSGDIYGSSNYMNPNCGHTVQTNSWFVNDVSSINGTSGLVQMPGATDVNYGSTCTADLSFPGRPVINWDLHPDAGQRRNFGYEIGIEIKKEALIANPTANSHTNVNVSIYDAAIADVGLSSNFGTGDSVANAPSIWGYRDSTGRPAPSLSQNPNGTPPLASFYPQRYTGANGTGTTYNGVTYGPPYTGTTTTTPDAATIQGQCRVSATYPSPYGTNYREDLGGSFRRCLSQYWVTDTNTIQSYYGNNSGNPGYSNASGVTFGAGQPYRFNETRTRYTLYFPPSAPGIPSVYNNVYNGKIASFEVGDMSLRASNFTAAYTQLPNIPDYYTTFNMPIEREPIYDPASGTYKWGNFPPNNPSAPANYQTSNMPGTNANATPANVNFNAAFCYLVSLNPPRVRVNDANGNPKGLNFPLSGTYTNTTPSGNYQMTFPQAYDDTQFAFACPAGSFYEASQSSSQRNYVNDYYWNALFPSWQFSDKTGRPVNAEEDVATNGNARSTTSGPYNVVTYTTNLLNNKPVTGWVTVAANEAPLYPYGIKPANTNYVDPGQECRISVSSAPGAIGGRGINGEFSIQQDGRTSTIEPLYEYGSPRMPFNAAYADRISNFSVISSGPNAGKILTQYWSRHGWRCNWDFDSDYDPRFNPLNPVTGEPLDQAGNSSISTNNGYSYYGNGKVEPFFHLTDWTWDAAGNKVLKKSPTDGTTVVPGSANAVVRPGTYMLQVQTYGGPGSNRYSVKAEYENASSITYTVGFSGTQQLVVTYTRPTPNVFGITALSLYTNATNPNNNTIDAAFDLAYISPDNAGSTAILQLFDPGDVQATGLQISVREPSPSGNRLTSGGKVALGTPLTLSLQSCPYYISNISACKVGPNNVNKVNQIYVQSSGNATVPYNYRGYFNDQWLFMTFQIPSRQKYDQYLNNCNSNNVPEQNCYYFQVDYELGKGNANDTTTWQIVVQGAPVRLLK